MGKTIAICCQKGGVGKSSTALALAAGLSLKEFKVLSIDLDAQMDFSYTVGAQEGGSNAMTLLTRNVVPSDAIQHIDGWGDVIPASRSLVGADSELTRIGKEYNLRETLEPVKSNYDYIILDTPPSLGIITINALTACDSVIIPAQADVYSLRGINQLSESIDAVRRYCNPAISIEGILLSRYSSRSILSRDVSEMEEELAENMGTKIFKAAIREAVAVKEAQIMQKSIFEYAPGANVTKDYREFIDEFLGSR